MDGANKFCKSIGLKGLTEEQAKAVKQNLSYSTTFLEATRRTATDAVTAQPGSWFKPCQDGTC